jgi:hypothetical protein
MQRVFERRAQSIQHQRVVLSFLAKPVRARDAWGRNGQTEVIPMTSNAFSNQFYKHYPCTWNALEKLE